MSSLVILQRIFLDFLLHIIFFPIWWYTSGAKKVLLGCIHLIQEANMQFAPGLWLKNIFVPMFGQRDWQGRITSFFMRLFNVIFRSIFLVIWSVVVFSFFILWIAFPLFVGFMLMQSFLAQFSV